MERTSGYQTALLVSCPLSSARLCPWDPITDPETTTVPFEEEEKDPSVWFLDHNYVESMNDMFKKINAREKLIGWYHSGPKLRASDLEINELFKRYTPNPLLVIIDVQPKESGVPTDAYFAVEEIKDVKMNLRRSEDESMLINHRTAPPHPRLSFIHLQSLKLRRQRRLVLSIC
jgi:proteasome lid subunit RPN8/RPN11